VLKTTRRMIGKGEDAVEETVQIIGVTLAPKLVATDLLAKWLGMYAPRVPPEVLNHADMIFRQEDFRRVGTSPPSPPSPLAGGSITAPRSSPTRRFSRLQGPKTAHRPPVGDTPDRGFVGHFCVTPQVGETPGAQGVVSGRFGGALDPTQPLAWYKSDTQRLKSGRTWRG